jgi:hypothetical protein
MIAYCHSHKGVVRGAEKTKHVRCPVCGQWNSLERISGKQANLISEPVRPQAAGQKAA